MGESQRTNRTESYGAFVIKIPGIAQWTQFYKAVKQGIPFTKNNYPRGKYIFFRSWSCSMESAPRWPSLLETARTITSKSAVGAAME